MNKKSGLLSIIVVISILGIGISFSGCVEEDENKIIVGTEATFPPFEYRDEEGNIIGFDIDMITTILENLNYTVEVKDFLFDSLIPSLENGKIDIIAAGMTIRPDREERIAFSIPYYKSDQSVLVKVDSNITINSNDDFENLVIGAQTGTTGALWVTDNLVNETALNVTLNRYDLYTNAVLDLDIGRIDAIVLDEPVAKAFAAEGNREVAYVILTNESFGIGVRKEDTTLLQQINQELEKFMDSDEWNDLVKKYFE